MLNFEKCDFYGSIQSRVPMGFTTSNSVEIGQTFAYGDLMVFKMVADAILGFQKFKFLTAGTFERQNLRHCAKFHHDRSIRC